MTPPDRLVGALCLVVALVAVTWGRGPAEERERRAESRATLAVSATEGADPGNAAATSSTTPGPAVTSTTTGRGSASTTTTRPAVTTTSTAPSQEADEALARRALLASADLPGGFVVVRPAPTGPADTDGPFERCLGSDAAALTAAVRAKARSAEYGRSGTGTVSSSAAVLDTPASAEKVLSTLATPAARACFEGIINTRLARNPKFSEDVRGTMAPLGVSGFGDQSTGFRFEVQLPAEDVENEPSASEERVPYIADFVFVRKGRVLALIEFGNLRQPFPPPDLMAVTNSVVRRAV